MATSYAIPRPSKAARFSVTRKTWVVILAFLGLHVILGLLMARFTILATLHAYATVAFALKCALFDRRLARVAYCAAYIVGAEVLWRIFKSGFFWEGAKYAIAAIFIIALVKRRCVKGLALPITFFFLLLPSIILILTELSYEEARSNISFNLSGPFTLAVSAWFFSNLKLSREHLLKLYLFIIAPVVSIAAVTIFGIVTARDVQFNGESNLALSGGFGPNQVSAILGLGAFIAFSYILYERASRLTALIITLVMMVFISQSALTFSRGGLYNASGAGLILLIFLLTDRRFRLKVTLLVTFIIFVIASFLLPGLDNFTGGTLSERFKDTDPTGRDQIILTDLEILEEHPVFGIGPGMSKAYHEKRFRAVPAHTEFSRLIAEHGVLGILAICLLFIMALRNFLRARNAESKAIVMAAAAWSFLYMLNAAMRLAAPSFIFGLSFALLFIEARRGRFAASLIPSLMRQPGKVRPRRLAARRRLNVEDRAANPAAEEGQG